MSAPVEITERVEPSATRARRRRSTNLSELRRRDRGAAFAMMLPAAFLILGFIAYPILDTFWMSVNRVDQFGRTSGFVGSGNYLKLIGDAAFRESFVRTVVWTVAVVGLTVGISLPLAWVLSFRFRGRVLLRAFLLLPWAASLVITSLLWRWMAHPDFGAVSRLLANLGIVETRIEWLANPQLSFPLMIWIAVWVSIPSITLILLAGIQGVDPGLYEAAAIDGAGSTRMFRSVALPLLRPVLAVAILLQVVHVFNSFPIIWVLTEGGPAGKTDTLVTYLYKIGFRLYDMGSAAAVSVLMFGILLIFAVVHTRLMWKDVAK
jgi:multiple sugar transport system permease protein